MKTEELRNRVAYRFLTGGGYEETVIFLYENRKKFWFRFPVYQAFSECRYQDAWLGKKQVENMIKKY